MRSTVCWFRETSPCSPQSWIYLWLSENDKFIGFGCREFCYNSVSRASGFARCLCRKQSPGSFPWFNTLINKARNYGLFQQMRMYEKMQYALGRAEDLLDATYLSNAAVPMWDTQGPQELYKWQVYNLIQSLILTKYNWEHLTSPTFLIRGRNKSLEENWQQHLHLLSFHYRK